MRGFLRIHSQRSPYLRAGLSWPLRKPVDIDIRDLDGARLLELARDPVLTVLVGDDDGQFHAAPELVGDISPDQAQLMIDAIATDMPARFESAKAADPVAQQLDTIGDQLRDAGFGTVEGLIEAYDQRGADLAVLRDQLREANSALEGLGDIEKLKADAAMREPLENERDAAQTRIAALEKEIADLKAKHTKPKADTKG